MWKLPVQIIIILFVLHIHFDGCLSGQNLADPRNPKPGGPGMEQGESYAEDFSEVASVLKGAVEDTDWLFSTSPAELRQTLSKYFTGPLLDQLLENTGAFTQKATEWSYQTVLEEYAIDIEGDQARAAALIREDDAITKESHYTQLHFQMLRTGQGWRITALSKN